MDRKKWYTTILLIAMNTILFAQEYEVIDTVKFKCTYLYEFRQDSNNINSVKNQEMVLQVGKRFSKYTAAHIFFSDSVIMENSKEPPTAAGFKKIIGIIGGTTIHPFCKNRIYKNYPEYGQVMLTDYKNKKYLSVVENVNINWEIVPNSDTIFLGYNCKKAKCTFGGRNYIALFTPEIPINDGPYKFFGLPGLILKISDTQNFHRIELLKIETVNSLLPMYFLQKNYISISPKQYVKALVAGNSQLMNRIQQGDGITINKDETKARALNTLKARNNFIERFK